MSKRVNNATPQPAAQPVADLAPSAPPEKWLEFADKLETGDVEAACRFLADQQLPVALAPVLAMVRPEAARLRAIVDADVPQPEIDAAEIHLSMLLQAHPATVDDAAAIGTKAAELTVAVRNMKRCRDAAAYAAGELAGLRNVFSEVLNGTPGRKACGTLSATLGNALRAAGFDSRELYERPWQQAYRLQPNRKPAARKRLRAIK